MSLFKPFMGNRANLDAVEKHAGHAYFCTNDGSFHIDYTDADGNLQRKQINANEAEKILGYDIVTVLNSSDTELPTSKAIFDALEALKAELTTQSVVILAEAQKSIAPAVNDALAQAKESGEFDGYTPVRGTDYWTDADKAEIKAYVDDAILNGAW